MLKETIRQNTLYPPHTAAAVKVTQMYQIEAKRAGTDRLSTRLVKSASVLEPGEFAGWQMIVPTKGLIRCSLFGTGMISSDDLVWAAEKTAKTVKCRALSGELPAIPYLYELYLPAAEAGSKAASIGFGAAPAAAAANVPADWPGYYSAQFEELIQVLRITGGIFRVVIGPADEDAQQLCRKTVLRNFRFHEISVNDYVGTPVQMRVLLRLPAPPSIRLRTVLNEACKESVLRSIGTMDQPEAAALWEAPLAQAPVLPDYAARILMLEPELHNPVVGMEICKEAMQKIPASHKNTKTPKAVTIGKATDTTGIRRKITIGEMDLKRHFQIVGQTGTGKSTLLSTLILSAIEQGHGLTFFDPHGSTIDTVLHSVPEKYADKIRVVRIGDTDNPVPLNIWDSDDPMKEERNISDLCELFGDLFNPPGEVFVGPRYERWLSTFAKASIAFLGKRASLESIAVISQSQDNMLRVSKAIIKKYPELVETIKQEYGKDNSSDFHSTLNWYLCKFQRLTSVEQLRKTLGAGTNALDFRNTIDTDTVTLIDLASPVIGTHAARIIGTLLLMKLWNAATARQERDKTHLVVVDEAALFQTNPMPRMLAESRKFGISMVLSHQHTGQLSNDIRDALEANSANFSAFRLSPRDAALAAIRFDDPEMQTALTRLDAFYAVTTLSVDGRQTDPFTLETIPPKPQKNGDAIAARIEAQSVKRLVEPYRDLRALTAKEILLRLKTAEELFDKKKAQDDADKAKADQEKSDAVKAKVDAAKSKAACTSDSTQAQSTDKPSFLDEWLKRRAQLKTPVQGGSQ